MRSILHKRVAAVDYVVTFPSSVSAHVSRASSVGFGSQQAPGDDTIRVNVVNGDLPDLSCWVELAREGDGWAILKHGALRCVCTGQPVGRWPAGVVATWSLDSPNATVHVSAELAPWQADTGTLDNPADYPIDQILLIYHVASRDGLLVHAAGLVSEGRALIFPGVSGAGKSTLSRQLIMHGSSLLLSDDRIFVRWQDGVHRAYGTPWPGEAQIAANASAPLAAVLFPARADRTRITELSPRSALDRLLPATSILWFEPELLTAQLASCERLLTSVPAYELAWSPALGVVDDLQDFVRRL
jgi:hypothetical protein